MGVRMSFDYSSQNIPDSYMCSLCGASQCKLWKTERIDTTYCVACVARRVKITTEEIDDDGTISDPHYREHPGRTNHIGWFIPAIPRRNKDGGWYTDTPNSAQESLWWRNIPTHPMHPQEKFFR